MRLEVFLLLCRYQKAKARRKWSECYRLLDDIDYLLGINAA